MCWGKMAMNIHSKKFKPSSKLFKFFLLGLVVCCLKRSTASRQGCNDALGMQSGKIKDWQLSAYSSDSGYEPAKGRLYKRDKAWCSKTKKPWTEYFTVKLDRVRHVSRLSTQGLSQFLFSYWVKTYAVRYSYDGWTWYWYKDASPGSAKEFDANTDADTVKRITFRDTFVTKYLRIYPITYKRDMCLRVEVYGCPDDKDTCTKTLNQATGVFTSPNYPTLYPRGVDCTWIITLPDRTKQVVLFFKHFDVNDGASWHCFLGDYVDVFDGPTDVSSSIGQYCNGDDMGVVEATGNVLRVHFHSESGGHPRKGFEAQFVSITKGVDDILVNKACHGSTLSLNCSTTSKSIKILHASYGTTPYSSRCGNVPTNSSCQATGVMSTVTSLCEQYKSCLIDVSSRQFGMSCGAGVVPRLTVYYQCTNTVIKTLPPTPSTTTSAPSTTTTAPSTVTPSTTNPTPSIKTDLISTATQQITSVAPTDPGSAPSTADDKWVTTSASPGSGGGNKLGRMQEDDDVGMLVGVIVAVILVVLILVIVLLCFLYRRRQRQKHKSMPGVSYTATPAVTNQAPTRSGSHGSRGNAYESVNVLYVSADDPGAKKDPYEHIYDSPELQEPLPKMTNNPLYHGATGFDEDFDQYESIDPPKEKPPLPPRSLAPSIYDSPTSQEGKGLHTSKTSISNPNYDKTVIDIQESEKH